VGAAIAAIGRRGFGGDVRARPRRPPRPRPLRRPLPLVFKYHGNAIEEGIDPLAFAGATLVACLLAAIGAWLFERRDLAA